MKFWYPDPATSRRDGPLHHGGTRIDFVNLDQLLPGTPWGKFQAAPDPSSILTGHTSLATTPTVPGILLTHFQDVAAGSRRLTGGLVILTGRLAVLKDKPAPS